LVFQLKRGDRQSIDEDGRIDCTLRLILAVPELPRDAKNILLEEFLGARIARRGRAVKQADVPGPCWMPFRSTSIIPRLATSP
jgi:hypothetical protein